jgi:hypothetical protein
MTAEWWSQPFAPEGSAAAEGIVKQLGRPALDPLAVLAREAAQNSWDARRDGMSVDFGIDVRVIGDASERWRRLLLPGPSPQADLDLESSLQPGSVVLIVSDRNTVGLGGPLRAGVKAGVDEMADFVQFLRNVGEPSDHQFGGGTYGFGKGIFYRLSRAGAILVDTKTEAADVAQRRLMGAALGHSWYLGDRRFTGRHWWGSVAADDIPDPVIGEDADKVSQALGLPGFGDGRSGTDIVILGADLGVTGFEPDIRERSPHEAATYLSSAILWNLWPKMISDERGLHMRFFVGVDGSKVAVPSPETVDDLKPFVAALRAVRAGGGTPYTRTVRPKDAGRLAVSLCAADDASSRSFVRSARPFDGPSHHIARMRVAELVVDYVPGPAHPDGRLAYAGVFRASEQADEHFASAEPPTHDDWVSKGLTGTSRGVVQGARSFIARQLDDFLGLGTHAGGRSSQGLGQFAARLASVVPARTSEDGGGAGSERGGGDGPSRGSSVRTRRGGTPKLTGSPVFRVHNGSPYLVATVLVPPSDAPRTVTAEVEVVIEGGGREAQPPMGAAIPEVIQWQAAATGDVVRGPSVWLSAGDASQWYVYATYVPDALVRFKVSQAADSAH